MRQTSQGGHPSTASRQMSMESRKYLSPNSNMGGGGSAMNSNDLSTSPPSGGRRKSSSIEVTHEIEIDPQTGGKKRSGTFNLRASFRSSGYGSQSGRTRSRKKSSFHTPRRREVQLSKISIYIVFMFVLCHRYVLAKL